MEHRSRTYTPRLFLFVAWVFLMVVAAGCAPAASKQETQEPVQPPAAGEPALLESERAAAGDEAYNAAPAEAPLVGGAAGAEGAPSDLAAVPPVAAEERAGEAIPIPLPTSAAPQMPDQAFQANLTAGEVNLHEDFQAYLQYRADYLHYVGAHTVHDLDVSERHVITVHTRGGQPVLGAQVTVYNGQSLVTTLRTTANGRAYFFPRAYPSAAAAQSFTIEVRKGQDRAEAQITRQSADMAWDITLNTARTRSPVNLDVLFLIDATGSMGDEIDELKNNILSISAQIQALPSRPDVRFGMVTYRDLGDVYVTQTYDFTPDVQTFQYNLQQVYASGGGDTPESLNEALHRAVNGVSWRVEDTVSLIFLVADAPPHLDYYQDYDYAQEMQVAASLGVKIFPISSELGEAYYQDQAAYIFKQLAVWTGGNFIFLTYSSQPQSSGEPGRTDVGVPEGSYTVQDLDALVVRLIQEELAALGAQ